MESSKIYASFLKKEISLSECIEKLRSIGAYMMADVVRIIEE